MIQANAAELLVSTEILDEWREVLSRPVVLRHFTDVSAEQVRRSIDLFAKLARLLNPPVAPLLVRRDPKDQKYLDLAFAGNAAFLVTRDRDLLELTADPQWRQTGPSFQIVDPLGFLRAMATN